MKKASTVIIVVLIVICIVLTAFAAGLNSQLAAEKAKTAKFNDQIAALTTKAGDLQARLDTTVSQANSQSGLVANLQSSLDAARGEINSLNAIKSDLEAKLNAELSKATDAISSVMPATK